MDTRFASADEAIAVISNPGDPHWGAAFSFLTGRPETAPIILEVFGETLAQLGVEPSGTDPETGLPTYRLDDVARAMGLPPDALGQAGD